MAFRDHGRLCLIVAIFLIVAILLVPQLSVVDVTLPGSSDDTGRTDWQTPPSQGAGAADKVEAPSTPKPSDAPPSSLKAGEKQPDNSFRLASPSGRFQLSLLPSGSLSLLDTKTDTERFTSDTEYYWPVTWAVELAEDAVLKLSWRHETEEPKRGTPWVSKMLPNCDPVPPSGQDKPVLELLDSGLLHIRVGAKSTCVLSRAVDDKGRLAIVYTGFLRTYLQTCEDQNKKLVGTWTGSGGADVHVFAYEEDVYHGDGEAVTAESIKQHLKTCFGEALKSVQILKLDDVQEKAENPAKALLAECPANKLDHHLSQWKALYLAGLQVQRYMVQNGVSYDYIFKGRLDLKLWGNIPPLSSLSVPPNGILAPRVALDWTWYAMLHDGELRAGVTDITALGRPNAMFTYLALYREFIHLRTMEKEEGKWKGFNTKQWIKDAAGQEGCSPEGILSYWLRLNGISVKTEWRFKMGLLRGNGNLIFTCPNPDRTWMCPGFVPHAREDGTLY